MTSPNIEPAVSDPNVEPALSELARFRFGAASTQTAFRAVSTSSTPDLGPLVAFAGTYTGNGFNTIFRPFNKETPTTLPNPVNTTDPDDNLLELNLTTEKLAFKTPLGAVPNRGSGQQGDVFLNGVPYLQTINDVTVPSQPVGIHFEPGLWMAVPATGVPAEEPTVARMASIPHGTTIDAQGTYSTKPGAPTILPVSITPSFVGGGPFTFQNQDAANSTTRRIPQDLTPFVAAGTITKEMLADPNTLLRNHIAHQTITSTTTISISTSPRAPLFGGGTDNIAFLLGNSAGADNVANANATEMSATFWIETVEYELEVPRMPYGAPPRVILAPTGEAGQPVPRFLLNPPHAIDKPRTIKVTTTQIQYSQLVNLQFSRLNWPHVSVATLVPNNPIPIPLSAWQ